jgi:hypothetical protein
MEPEPEGPVPFDEGVPPVGAGVGDNAPSDQGGLGTCAVHAVVTVVAQRLMLKYNKVLDEPDAHSAIERAAQALAGSHVVEVVETVNTLTEQGGLKTMGKKKCCSCG